MHASDVNGSAGSCRCSSRPMGRRAWWRIFSCHERRATPSVASTADLAPPWERWRPRRHHQENWAEGPALMESGGKKGGSRTVEPLGQPPWSREVCAGETPAVPGGRKTLPVRTIRTASASIPSLSPIVLKEDLIRRRPEFVVRVSKVKELLGCFGHGKSLPPGRPRARPAQLSSSTPRRTSSTTSSILA